MQTIICNEEEGRVAFYYAYDLSDGFHANQSHLFVLILLGWRSNCHLLEHHTGHIVQDINLPRYDSNKTPPHNPFIE